MKTELEKHLESLPPSQARALRKFYEEIRETKGKMFSDLALRLELSCLERSRQNHK